MCEHVFLCLEYCSVCKLCGITHRVLKLDSYNVYSAPINRGYSRLLRFKTKVDKILLGTPQPKYQDPVWKYLNSRKDLVTPLCVRQALKQSKLVNKHYDNVKLFCDVFTQFKITTAPIQTIHKYMLTSFKTIHDAWNFSTHETFFSYTWLIRFLLERINSKFIIYLKAPTSTKRHEKYQQLLDCIIPPETCDKKLSRGIEDIHSLSG